MSKNFIVAIDGTAGSGKSTTARGSAKVLGFYYLNTGAMYRAMTYKIFKEKIDINNIKELQELLSRTTIEFKLSNSGKSSILLDNNDVTKYIRTPKVDSMVSLVSAIPIVREKMVKEQRRIAQDRNIVVEGRDIGSVVFPNADLKFFLDCSLEKRASRRKKELNQQGDKIGSQVVENNLAERDQIDSTRKVSPLKQLPDAVYLDTSDLTIEQEIQFVVQTVREKLGEKCNH
jgi:cytidylate kinase